MSDWNWREAAMDWKEFLDGRKFTAKEHGVLMPGQRVGRVTLTGWYFRWVAQNLPETPLYQFLRMLEVPAIIVALVAFWVDFIVDRPADRIIRAWTVIAQSPNANGNIGQTAALTALAKAGQDIRGVNLTGAWLVGANLSGFKLIRANLTHADLTFADLTDTDLTLADLAGANLPSADLRNVNLTNANLRFAELANTDLTGANLRGTTVNQQQLDSACIRKGGAQPALPEGLKPPQNECAPYTR
jgi:hypothetical protein